MTKSYDPIPSNVEEVASQVIDATMAVHRELGPGLLESVYEVCLCYELSKRGIPFERQLDVPVVYDNKRLDTPLRLDVLVDSCVVVELKAVEKMIPLYEAQLLTYLKLTRTRLGLLINFNVPLLKDGLKRMVL
jgi:GxxExxY protein